MKYKLIKLLPFENSPRIGYISQPHCTQKDGAHYWNRNWFNPKDYPEFWEKVVEKDYEILSLVASEKHPQHKKGSKFLHNKDYKFKNMHPTEFWDIYSVKRISDNKIFTIGDFYEDLIIEKMFMSVDDNILTTYKPKIKEPIFQTEDGIDIFAGMSFYYVCEELELYNTICCTDEKTYKNVKQFSTKEKAEEYILLNKPVLSYGDVQEYLKVKDCNKVLDLAQSKIQQSV